MMAQRAHKGFTLIELLVVIGIMVLLLAIIVPIGKRLRESNNTSRCEAQLAHIGQALKAYFLDEGGFPLMGVTASGGAPTDPPVANFDAWPGLETLFYSDYLRNHVALHCPRHIEDANGVNITSASPEFYRSYMLQDEAVKADGIAARQFKYSPYRYADALSHPDDYRRQLARTIDVVNLAGQKYVVSAGSRFLPPDDTIVTWCNYHAETYRINGQGQYVVLFWDGSVRLLDQDLFTDASVGPLEGWMVKPGDSAH